MSRYFRVWKTFALSSILRDLQFKLNFFAKAATNGVWMLYSLLILGIVFMHSKQIADWNQGQIMTLLAAIFFIEAIIGGFFFSLNEIPTHVQQGTLDFILTKPVDSQFWISVRKFDLDKIGPLLIGIATLVYGLMNANTAIGWAEAVCYLVSLPFGVLLYYSLNLAMMTTSIWFIKVENLWILSDSALQVARFPLNMYPAQLVRFFIFLFPIGLFAFVPTSVLFGKLPLWYTAISILWGTASFFAARKFWFFALRHYSSASS